MTHSSLLLPRLAGSVLAIVAVLATFGAVSAQDSSPSPSTVLPPASAAPELLPSPQPLDSPQPPAATTPVGTWVAAAYDGRGDGLVEPLRGSVLTVWLLPDGRLEGTTACGSYIGGWFAEGEAISLSVVSRGSDPCGNKRKLETLDFTEALTLTTSWAPSERGLELRDEAGVARVRFDRPAHDGVIGEWLVQRYVRPNGKLVGALEGTELTVSFDGSGLAAGSASCRTFETAYVVEADRIAIEPLDMTGLPCEGPDRRQERHYEAALGSAITWTRDGAELLLLGPDGDAVIELISLEAPAGA